MDPRAGGATSFGEMLERERRTFHGKTVKPVDKATLRAGPVEVKVLLVHGVQEVEDLSKLLHEIRMIVYVDGKPSMANSVRSWWTPQPKE